MARASAKLDHRCDLWALATIAYEGLSGELPLDGEDSDELLKNLCAGRTTPLLERSPEMPPADQFWGDRMGTVKDSFGNSWSLATHNEDVSPEEMAKRMAAMRR